ncbi:3-methylornithine--L-lysine ligase PylC [Desulfitobacterium chlororespirans]|uniref:Pyrrolysine biosynthesis protein PylC n=1 Tax=Desulfitobacterium chlororespirans DSM 11544 TaxID=1121395 RepID=A0A1M7TDR7_9FIRM|nr:3-methylornithine--L-lysine ligase PylC [Desulfitobacterium chlororespirans]SHN68843.1 pyrrolysine biosynthesis protein PylC [Desulfitobacterium chlororespirans DSM 11544]
MQVAIIGGKLQGVEAAYLAKKAGWDVVLFDRREKAQGAHLADVFHCMDVLRSREEFVAKLQGADLILPAVEDVEVLTALAEVGQRTQIPCVLDLAAYKVSSSKQRSNQLFAAMGIPTPRPWPDCHFPMLLKPSDRSGSEGVQVIPDQEELERVLHQEPRDNWILEEYIEGPSYSIEVIGFSGKYQVFQITELEMDAQYDCKRVLAPVRLDLGLKGELKEIALKLARELSLQGIMDVEVILHAGKLKVLEIDARLPSQTPTAVFHSTGLNMVEYLGEAFVQGKMPGPGLKQAIQKGAGRPVILEHFLVTPEKIEACGEHILGEAGPLHLLTDFFGADEVLTDYAGGKKEWVLSLMTWGSSFVEVWDKRAQVLKRIQRELQIPKVLDPYPLSQCPVNAKITRY